MKSVSTKKRIPNKINPPVFFISALIILSVVAIAAIFPERSETILKSLQTQIFENASWFYILAVALILLTVSYLGISRFGEIKLGPIIHSLNSVIFPGLQCCFPQEWELDLCFLA